MRNGTVRVTALFILALFLYAEEPLTYSVDVSVVNVFATVRDRDGRLVTDLGRDDFVLEENGKRQEVKYFARHANVPLTLGLLVDTSMSQKRLIKAERRASAQFFEQVLRPGRDLAFIIKFDFDVALLQDLTDSRRALRYALDDLQVARFGSIFRDPGRLPRAGGVGTSMYDAVYLAADEMMRKITGRKALILITDGVDMGSLTPIDTAIEYAQRADSMVYCIRYFDPRGYYRAGRGLFGGAGKKGTKALKRLAAQTGGLAFQVGEDYMLSQIFTLIEQDLRSQ